MEAIEFSGAVEKHQELSEDELVGMLEVDISRMLLEEPHKLFSYLYRIDVSEHKVKEAMQTNDPAKVLSVLIIRKLKEKLYWRNLYKK